MLVTTDNHLGYGEGDEVRGDDSFAAFDEACRIAKDRKVDMMLLAGDLFHDNRPSRRTMHRAMSILRRHCMGDGDIKFEVLSDPERTLSGGWVRGSASGARPPPLTRLVCSKSINFEDPDYNVELPIFSIHGNHDDPTSDGVGKVRA